LDVVEERANESLTKKVETGDRSTMMFETKKVEKPTMMATKSNETTTMKTITRKLMREALMKTTPTN
jgi:hypothetical protein